MPYIVNGGDARLNFAKHFEKRSFAFQHSLAESPLLTLEALRRLADGYASESMSAHFEMEPSRSETWNERPDGLTVLDAFERLNNGNILILFNGAHRFSEYAMLLSEILSEVEELLSCDMRQRYRRPILTIIVASPFRTTPYHMDDSENLLMQVKGTKSFPVFDGSDPTIVSPEEREAFWKGDMRAAVYTKEREAKAHTYQLGPGDGVHVPTTYPHLARNGNETSVAVSVNFKELRNPGRDVVRINCQLERLGLKPASPGRNPVRDHAKMAIARAMTRLHLMNS
jgi:hypothetical protein